MRNRTRMIAAAAVIAALAAGSGAAAASTTGAKPGVPAKTLSASGNPDSPAEMAGHNAMVAAVAQELHMSTARVSAALQPLFAASRADTSSVVAAAARSLGVSTQQLSAALAHAKQSLGGGTAAKQGPGGSKAVGANSTEERQGHDAMVAAVARELHVGTARVSAALQPLFAAGRADTSSPVFAAAARSLGVSTQQLSAALGQAKQSLAPGN
jgi:2-hydroxychromene-2-carboxylate isomerase